MVYRGITTKADLISRRDLLITATALSSGAIAGCLDDTTGDSGKDNENKVSDETRELAAEMVETIDDELQVTDWKLHDMFVPEYTDSGGVEADIPILGDAYAEIVDQGFDRRAMPTALDEDENTEFMVFLEPEWTNAYLDGELTEEEYYAEIKDSEH